MKIKRLRSKYQKGNERAIFKPIIVPIYNMDKFEQKEMIKKRQIKKKLFMIG